MNLTATQGKALVQLLAALRRDWQPAGIEAAIRKAITDGATGPDVCVAAVRVAVNPEAQTPGLLNAPGDHWRELRAGRRMAPIDCPEHAGEPSGRCVKCREESVPPPPGWRNRATTEESA